MDVLTPSSQPSLPIDVVKEVIDQLQSDTRTLRSFTLTCREFVDCSRVHLFCTIRVASRDSFNALSKFLDIHPRLRRVVRSVRFDNYDSTNPTRLVGALPLHVLAKFPTAREWYWNGNLSSKSVSIHRTILAGLRGRSVVETLEVHMISFMSYSDLFQLLCAFPHLRYLTCRKLEFRKDIQGSRNPQRGKPTLLSTLLVDDLDETLIELLLDLTKDTLEYLILGPNCAPEMNDIDLSTLNRLRSLTLHLNYDPTSTRLNSIRTTECMKHLSIQISTKPRPSLFPLNVSDLLLLFKLEDLLRGRSLETCTFQLLGAKKNSESRWRDEIRHSCPDLHTQTRVAIECLANDGGQTSAVGHRGAVLSLDVSPDGVLAATCSQDGLIILWDIQQRRIVQECGAGGPLESVAFSPDGRYLASSGPNTAVTIWDVNYRLDKLSALEGHTEQVRTCAWSPDGTKLASVANGDIRVWDAETWQELYSLASARTQYPIIRFSPDSQWLLGGYRLYAASTGVEHLAGAYDWLDYARSPQRYVMVRRTAAFDPASERIAIASGDKIRVWTIESGEELIVIEGHTQDFRDVSFSPDGTHIVSASEDNTVKIWSSATGAMLSSLEGHRDLVSVACFSPDGKHIASASDDRTVRVWRVCDGSCLWTFCDHAEYVLHVAFSPDGEFLLSGEEDGSVCIQMLSHFISGWNK